VATARLEIGEERGRIEEQYEGNSRGKQQTGVKKCYRDGEKRMWTKDGLQKGTSRVWNTSRKGYTKNVTHQQHHSVKKPSERKRNNSFVHDGTGDKKEGKRESGK